MIRIQLIIFFLALGLVCRAGAESSLTRVTAARPLALGNAFIGLADDGSAIFINPAGLTGIKYNNFSSLYTAYDPGFSYVALAGAFPHIANGTFGLGLRSFNSAGVVVSSETVDYADQELILTFARRINPGLSLGGDLRYLAKTASKENPLTVGAIGSGLAVDLSIKYNQSARVSYGAAAQNLAGNVAYRDGTSQALTPNLTIGTALRMLGEEAFYGHLTQTLLLNIDANKESGSPICLHLGAEWWPLKNFALRLGFDQTPKNFSEVYTNNTVGIGLKIAGITFDYTLYTANDASGGTTNYFSLGYVGPEEVTTREAVRPTLRHFSDVPKDYWAREPIEKLTALGLLNWYPDGTFRPEQPVARAETVTFLVSAKDYPRPKELTQVFPDVPPSFWAAESIQAAYEQKLTIGYPDGDFKPRNNTTRAETVTFLTRFEKLPRAKVKEPPFSDLTKEHWAIREVLAAKQEGLLGYLDSQPFQPSQSLTRAELAEMLYRTRLTKEKLQGWEFSE